MAIVYGSSFYDDGAKRWELRVTILKSDESGKIVGNRHMGLGPFPRVSLAEAREKAAHFRKIAQAGGDPIAERRREREVRVKETEKPTFRAL